MRGTLAHYAGPDMRAAVVASLVSLESEATCDTEDGQPKGLALAPLGRLRLRLRHLQLHLRQLWQRPRFHWPLIRRPGVARQ